MKKLWLKVIITGILLALPAAALVTWAVERVRARDMALALERVVTSLVNDQERDRCETDPKWFLTGPLEGRPPRDQPREPDPDGIGPRPKIVEMPFELFAYDEEFTGTSVAAPRMPPEVRRALRQTSSHVVVPFDTPAGRGVQIGIWTGWSGGPCAIWLGRMRPRPGVTAGRLSMFTSLAVLFFAVAVAALAPLVRRVRRLASDAQASVRQEYGSIAPDSYKDELSAVTFAYNDAAKELHLRRTTIADRDEAMRRYVAGMGGRIAPPLALAAERLGALVRSDAAKDNARDALRRVFQETLEVSDRLDNLIASARLRASGDPIAVAPVDLGSVAAGVVDRYQAAAHAAGVSLELSRPSRPVVLQGDAALFTRALANLVDNAIRYNRSGGRVVVSLSSTPGTGRMSLTVTDNGNGVTDDEYKGLSAIRRFRGDEDRLRQPHAPGMGLAVAREVAERFGLQMTLTRPAQGGFEVEWTGPAVG
jgi:signal transduction histidine kinase